MRTVGRQQQAMDVHVDGDTLMFAERTAAGDFDLRTISLSSPGNPTQVAASRFNEWDARFAPNGRAIAFVSNESGQSEVYVAAFPAAGARVAITTGGGWRPRWSRDGRELFYLTRSGLMATTMTGAVAPDGPQTRLFEIAGLGWQDFDVARDGRFIAVVGEKRGSLQPVSVIVNWPAARPLPS